MRILDAAATIAALPYPALSAAIHDVLLDTHARAPERSRLELRGGVLLLMPALDAEFAVTKLVTVHAGNSALPTVQGEVILMRADTGERLLMLDGVTVTARRTAAVSLLAAQHLAPTKAGNLLVVGSGSQARSHLEAFGENLELGKIWVSSRNFAHAEKLAAEFGAVAIHDPAEVIEDADFICTTTNANAPVIPNNVKPSAFIAAVGAYRPDMLEIPPTITRRARVVVDDLIGARSEAGDLIQAGLEWGNVESLQAVVGSQHVAPATQQPVLFKSVGCALWDLAAARLAYQVELSGRRSTMNP